MNRTEPSVRPAAESDEMTSLGSRAASGAIWITVEMITVQGFSLVVFSILAHFLDAHDFGLIAISFVFIYSFKSLTIDQIITPIIRKANPSDLEYTTAFWIILGMGVLATSALCGFSFTADAIFRTDGLGKVMRAMSLIMIALSLSQTQEAWLMRNLQLRVLAVRSIVGMILGAIAGIGAAIMHFGVWSLVIQQSVASFSALALLWLTTTWRPSFHFSRSVAAEIFNFVRGIGGSAVFGIINRNADTALVAFFFGPSAAGVYSVGKRLAFAIQQIAANSINRIALSVLSEVQEDKLQLQRVFLMASRFVFTSCAPIFLGGVAVAPIIITLLFGEKWIQAANIFSWLSVGSLLSIAFDYFGAILLIRDHPVWLTWLAALQTALLFGVFFVLYRFGESMIAVPFVLPYVILLPICAMLSLRLLGLSFWQWAKAVTPRLSSRQS